MEKRAGVKSLVANISPAERELSSPISTSHTSVRRKSCRFVVPFYQENREARRAHRLKDQRLVGYWR
jgi:hypothetical protein